MIAYVDMFSGISGDMALGAFVDLGVPVDWLVQKLSGVFSGFDIHTETVYKHHLKAVDLSVNTLEKEPPHRHYPDIRAMIRNGDLPAAVKQKSLAAFKKIAAAEAEIHGKDIESVHFHEVGAVDSLVDIIGTFLCVEYLGITRVYASEVPLGSGRVRCAHGVIPVPVPATIAILKDTPVRSSDAKTEIVTPTGAAIITTLTASFGVMPQMSVKRVGYGAGKRDTGSELPNLLRIVLGEAGHAAGPGPERETIHVVKANVDDMSPELSGYVMACLFKSNALDVCFVPVQMKKNRPGIQMEILCRQPDLETILHQVLTQTTSIGVRYHTCERAFLAREKAFIKTSLGEVQVKKIITPDGSSRYLPEFEAARKMAEEKALPLKDVYTVIMSDAAVLDRGNDSI